MSQNSALASLFGQAQIHDDSDIKRVYSRATMATRADILLEPIGRTASIIEIGPSYNPLAPKSQGWNTQNIDVATKSELIEKYGAHASVNVENIEEVDFVWREGTLIGAVPQVFHGTFDAFIASHVIEHTPDFVEFLDSAATLLAPTGIIVLAVPDKRYCFDYFRPLTMTGDVLASHAARRTRHNKQSIFNNAAYLVSANKLTAWDHHNSVENFAFLHSLDHAYYAMQNVGEDETSPYYDLHSWQFTPASFQLLFLELARLQVTDWQVDRVYSAGFEFYAWLRRGGGQAAAALSEPELNAQRLTLLRNSLLETKAQVDRLVGV